MSERRYSDEEVAEIFSRATEARPDPSRRQLSSGPGMTLAELQDIGREAGIAPEEVARAARKLDQPPPVAPRTFLGLPLYVGHAVELDYRMDERQWERLVVDLRTTFDAAGRVRSEGAFRTWTNGNLQVLVEPGEHGDRVRFRTMKGTARSMMTGGVAMLSIALVLMVAAMLMPGASAPSAFWLAVMGGGAITYGVATVPGWARLRKQQMEEIGERLLAAPTSS